VIAEAGVDRGDEHLRYVLSQALWLPQIPYSWSESCCRRRSPQSCPHSRILMQGWRTNGRRKAAQEVHLDGFTDPDGELYRPRSFQAARR
jgi:hypothetical protein